MKDLIFVGSQGSGKGTQAKVVAERHGFQIFETGGALRKMAQEDSELGRKVKEITERGDLVPNEIVMEIVENFLQNIDPSTPAIFDGIPRSEEQRVSLEALLESKGREFAVIQLEVSEDVVMARLLKRAEIEGRADDNPESIKKRIANFYAHTQPLLDVWKTDGRLHTVNGAKAVEDVDLEIEEKIANC